MSNRLCMSCKPCSNQLEMDYDRCSEIYEEYWKDRLPTDPINITEMCTLYYNKGRADALKMYLLKDCESCKASMLQQIRVEVIDKLINKVKSVQFHTGKAWFDFDAGIDRCIDIAEKLKEDYT